MTTTKRMVGSAELIGTGKMQLTESMRLRPVGRTGAPVSVVTRQIGSEKVVGRRRRGSGSLSSSKEVVVLYEPFEESSGLRSVGVGSRPT